MPKRYDYIITNNYDKEMIVDMLDSVKSITNSKRWNTENKTLNCIQKLFKGKNEIALNDSYSVLKIEADY